MNKSTNISRPQFNFNIKNRLNNKLIRLQFSNKNNSNNKTKLNTNNYINKSTDTFSNTDYSKLNRNKKVVETENDNIEALELKLLNKANNIKNQQQILTLVLGDHYITFQLERDLYTLIYTSIVFKWFNNEKVIYSY